MSEKKYSKDHEWVFIENEIAIVGITNYAQESLGDIVFLDRSVIHTRWGEPYSPPSDGNLYSCLLIVSDSTFLLRSKTTLTPL